MKVSAAIVGAVLAACITVASPVSAQPSAPQDANPIAPDDRRSLELHVISAWLLPSEHDRFFDSLERFARDNDFAFYLIRTRPDLEIYLFEMRRPDVHIVGSNDLNGVEFWIEIWAGLDDMPFTEGIVDELGMSLRAVLDRVGVFVTNPE